MSHTWKITYMLHGLPRSTSVNGLNIYDALEKFNKNYGLMFVIEIAFVVPNAG